MYLKSFKLTNFRKFGTENNEIRFSNPEKFGKTAESSEEKEISKVSAATTLMIGKNNAGKTTIIDALEKLCCSRKKFTANDFNFAYLTALLDGYKNSPSIIDSNLPEMSFVLEIGLDEEDGDLYTKIADFLTIGMIRDKSDVAIKAIYQISEAQKFTDNFETLKKSKPDLDIDDFLSFLSEQQFEVVYFNGSNKVDNFRLSNLINLSLIPAYERLDSDSLSSTFGKILHDIYIRDQKDRKMQGDLEPNDLEKAIGEAERSLTDGACREQVGIINTVLNENITGRDFSADLRAKITLEKLIKEIMHYRYVDNGLCIPEGQFGLGYTRLMMVLAHILEHIHENNGKTRSASINVIAIEEPEIHMHPQMQEYFIQDIAFAISALVKKNEKTLNCQLLISTHSDHIIYSKILSGNSFDYVNYIYETDCYGYIVPLEDEKISNVGKEEEEAEQKTKNNLSFLRRHLRLSSYSIFFADAVILVEGYAEQILIPLYINEYDTLKKHYVSVVSVDGAHAHIYFNLLSCLQLPTVVITDLDFRSSEESKFNTENKKESRKQETSLEGRETSNKTIKEYYEEESKGKSLDLRNVIKNEKTYRGNDRIKLFTQTKCNGYYPTSFEEALILENYQSDLMDDVLRKVMCNKRKEILKIETNADVDGNTINYKRHAERSYDWYCSLANKKGEFASELFYELVVNHEQGCTISNHLKMPEYIRNALSWLDGLLDSQKTAQISQKDL